MHVGQRPNQRVAQTRISFVQEFRSYEKKSACWRYPGAHWAIIARDLFDLDQRRALLRTRTLQRTKLGHRARGDHDVTWWRHSTRRRELRLLSACVLVYLYLYLYLYCISLASPAHRCRGVTAH